MNDSFHLGRIAGFPLAVNWSVLVILWLLTWNLADNLLPHGAPGHSSATYWVAGFVAAILFLGSLLAHELAHALVARKFGVEVKGLTLWLFGGVASLGGEAKTPSADFRIAIAGPATSLSLAIGFGLITATLIVLDAADVLASAVGWLAGINLMLGIFNLIPGAPLDGGRVLRAWLWRRHGDRTRAALSATRAGQKVAYGLIWLGIFEFLLGANIGGLWMVFIGWFVLTAAKAEEADIRTRALLAGVRVGDVMSRDPDTGPDWLTIDEFVQEYVLGKRHSAYPVKGHDGRIDGLVTLAQIRAALPENRGTTRVGDVAIPLARVPIASPGDELMGLLSRLSAETGGRALVFEGDVLVGIVTPTDVTKAIEIRALDDGSRPLALRSRHTVA